MKKDILNLIATNEFDYNILCDLVKDYRFPRNKIGALIKAGEIIRVKKGYYVKAGANFNRFIVANMIYGPSYVSEDSALSYYGLIPERVEAVTSTSLQRKRSYVTPIGVFQYNTTQPDCYTWGVTRVQVDERRAYLIASPEKALFDRLYHVNGLNSFDAMREYLFMNMRLDETTRFNISKLTQLAKLSGKTFAKILTDVLKAENS